MSRVEVHNLCKMYASSARPRQRFWDLVLGRGSSGTQFVALDRVSLSVPPGHTLGLVGRNGSGKSTFLQILCGTLTASSGTVQVRGKIAALLELGSGFNPEFTGRENVYLNGSLLGLSRQEVTQAFESICSFAEIGAYIDQPVKTYSSGMFVRLAFAVVIHTKPDLLVVDEALAVGDARFQAKCLAAIRDLKSSGVSIVLVTHDVATVRQVCDSAVWLRDGAVAMKGDVNAVTSAYTAYLFAADSDGPPEAAPIAVAPHELGGANSVPLGVPESAWQPNQPPLNRWGSMPGTINGCSVCDADGAVAQVWHGCNTVTITVRFRLKRAVPLETLSVAIAIKDLHGHDLVVLSTWDTGWRFTRMAPDCDETVSFTFANPLNVGKYTLVAAVEDRRESLPHYYDFIEGAQYLEILHDSTHMGLVVVSAQVQGNGLIQSPQSA